MKRIFMVFAIILAVSFLWSFSLKRPEVLSQSSYSLLNRYKNPYINSIFTDNILLTLAYIDEKVKKGDQISWEKVKAPNTSTLTLKPGHTFAFHDNILKKYQNQKVVTTNAHFISSEGFKSDGWLMGDGVCHLASFLFETAKKAGLKAEAPTRHDFAPIADIQKKDGVSIYYSPDNSHSSALQNLYITNNRSKPIAFVFNYDSTFMNIK